MRKKQKGSPGPELLDRYAGDILASQGMQSQKTFRQHGEVSCYEHSVAVALLSVRLANFLRARTDKRSLIRGALLHDYYLYDWHVADKSHRFHGFIHAKRALGNAERDFELTAIERDIIARHMFPLNPRPPRYKESYIVMTADRICTLRELLSSAGRRMKKAGKAGNNGS